MDVVEIGAFEAKTKLSQLLQEVSRGRVYRITKRGKVVAELRPAAEAPRPTFGANRGKIWISKDFDKPLDDFKDYM